MIIPVTIQSGNKVEDENKTIAQNLHSVTANIYVYICIYIVRMTVSKLCIKRDILQTSTKHENGHLWLLIKVINEMNWWDLMVRKGQQKTVSQHVCSWWTVPCFWGSSAERVHSSTPDSSLSALCTAHRAASPCTETGRTLTDRHTDRQTDTQTGQSSLHTVSVCPTV